GNPECKHRLGFETRKYSHVIFVKLSCDVSFRQNWKPFLRNLEIPEKKYRTGIHQTNVIGQPA
ncbi:hypothetical protein, partial [Thalassospira alkalitolerans]|uniref:hypothetical protein n=1 Tax=Thalassospira alkalitolerans TaxID=1293890 RepID=UPI001B80E759